MKLTTERNSSSWSIIVDLPAVHTLAIDNIGDTTLFLPVTGTAVARISNYQISKNRGKNIIPDVSCYLTFQVPRCLLTQLRNTFECGLPYNILQKQY